jgi:hypothetical protein
VSKRDFPNELLIQKDNGFYEIKSSEGIPVRFDKVVLYYLLHKLSADNDLNSAEVVTTRYEISKNVFSQEKNFSKAKYDRIMLALRRWKAIYIRFEGVFLEESGNFTEKYFAIIDSVVLDKKTKKLWIRFNDLYIKQIRESRLYKTIDFEVYKTIMRPVAIRLYEILMSRFLLEKKWLVYIDDLGEQLTLGKRAYPSQILVALKPAIKEINSKANLGLEFSYIKETGICVFKKISPCVLLDNIEKLKPHST